jgi:uncharacterized protein
MRLIPRDTAFFDLFDQQAQLMVRAAKVLAQVFDDFENLKAHADTLDKLEDEADEVTHELQNRVDETFITPLDKEDMRALSSGLDDVVDQIEAAASRMVIYHVGKPEPELARMAELLCQITEETAQAIRALRTLKDRATLKKLFIAIHKTENASDTTYRQALSRLFDSTDAIYIIKWKEIYERIEESVDKCEDVANVIESIMVKYA